MQRSDQDREAMQRHPISGWLLPVAPSRRRAVSGEQTGPPRGRPATLTKELIDELAAAIATGAPLEQACQRVGIDVSTFTSWRAGRFPGTVPANLRRRFARQIGRSEAKALFQALTTIKRSGSEDVPADTLEAAEAVIVRLAVYGGRPGDVVGGDIGDLGED